MAVRCRPASSASTQAELRAAETRRGFHGFGVGLAAAVAGSAAAGWRESKGAGGPQRGPWPRPRPRPRRGPQTLPGRLAWQGAAGAPGASLRRGGTFPTGSDPAPTRGTGAPRARVTGKPFRVCAGGGGWGVGEEKKRGGFARSLCGPLPPGRHPPPSPLRTAAPGGSDPEGPARSHGLGFLEPPGRPGGCRQWGKRRRLRWPRQPARGG